MSIDQQLVDHLRIGPPTAGERPGIAPVVRYGSMLIASGQTAVGADGTLISSGIVGDTVDLIEARRAAWQCAANVLNAVRAELGSLDQVERVLRLTIYVASAPTFIEQHLVADAATILVHETFGAEVGRHSRAAIGVAALPTGSSVEVDGIFLARS